MCVSVIFGFFGALISRIWSFGLSLFSLYLCFMFGHLLEEKLRNKLNCVLHIGNSGASDGSYQVDVHSDQSVAGKVCT